LVFTKSRFHEASASFAACRTAFCLSGGYESLGYTILLPGSALPGWPAEVPLPIDPEWKRDYAASVRRLIRDGVDVPLTNLFVHAARSPKLKPVVVL